MYTEAKGGILLKIEKLADDKIKITITIDDLEARNIDLDSFIGNSPASQDLFWDLMIEAEKEYGFDVNDSMIYVEASATNSGSFTFIVTKTEEKPPIKIHTHKYSKDSVKLKRKKMPYFFKNGIYKFETFDDVCDFCKNVDTTNITDTKLFSYENKYYLKAGIIPSTSILEYAEVVKSTSLIESRLKEFGNLIVEKEVIDTINNYFNKKKKHNKKQPV